MKVLTKTQAETIFAFFECFDLCTSGVWAQIKKAMCENFGIEDPEAAIEEARQALID